MKSKSTKSSKKLSDRAAKEKSVRNRVCLLELQLVELKGKRSYVTVNFYRIKVTPTCKGGRYEHFYWIRFFIRVTDRKKSKPEDQRRFGSLSFSLGQFSFSYSLILVQ
ncbi:uncharacterized protein DS421_10g292460 [Arachis hypogaea]|nr:uncharacterized protein DS421_10g292460 [Arachis hypogaea]